MPTVPGVEIRASIEGCMAEIRNAEALAFVANLQRAFGPTREALLRRRAERQAELDAAAVPDFLPETRVVRAGGWRVAPPPAGFQQRWVEAVAISDRFVEFVTLPAFDRIDL